MLGWMRPGAYAPRATELQLVTSKLVESWHSTFLGPMRLGHGLRFAPSLSVLHRRRSNADSLSAFSISVAHPGEHSPMVGHRNEDWQPVIEGTPTPSRYRHLGHLPCCAGSPTTMSGRPIAKMSWRSSGIWANRGTHSNHCPYRLGKTNRSP